MNKIAFIFKLTIILLLVVASACYVYPDIDHFIKSRYGKHMIQFSNNMDPFTHVESVISFDNKIPFESIDIWVMKKGKPYSSYDIYHKAADSFCKNSSHDKNTMLFPCRKIVIDGLDFVYRDSYDTQMKVYFRESYYQDDFTIIRMTSLFKKKDDVTNSKINEFVGKSIKNLPLIWKVDDPISSYEKAFSHLVACRQRFSSEASSVSCEKEYQSLLNTSENMKHAIDQMNLRINKNLVTSEFIHQYQLLMTNTARGINAIAPSDIKKWSEEQRNKFYKMRSLLISLFYLSQDQDNDGTKDKLAIQLYPYAAIVLKNHPNDPKLCTIIASNDSDDQDKPFIKAEKIAFMQKGDRYCNAYYSKISSWFPKNFKPMTPSLSGENVKDLPKKKQLYYNLSYSAYYNQYVVPKIPEALSVMKDKQKNQAYCENKGYFIRERNPYLDAIRQAYLQEGSLYCSHQSTRLTSFDNDLTCFEECKALGVLDRPIDCVEKCKKSPGVLFQNNSYVNG